MASVYPPDPTTAVGFFRSEIGDVTPVEGTITGTVPSQTAEYEFFSDAMLEAYLSNYPDDLPAAESAALQTMGRRLMIAAQDIQVDDIRIKTVERAKLFLEHADKIAAGVLTSNGASAFGIVSLDVIQPSRRYDPQGTPSYLGSL